MRISDWSSDVCSSDLREGGRRIAKTTSAVVTSRSCNDFISSWRAAPSCPATRSRSMQICFTLFSGSLQKIDPTSRSEEHTSELQSLMRISYAVFCLKKKNNTQHAT